MTPDLGMQREEPERIRRALSLAGAVMEVCEAEGIATRLLGGLAVWERCPRSHQRLARHARSGDFDLLVHLKDRTRFERLLGAHFELRADALLAAIPGETHARFYTSQRERVCDVTYDAFVFNHRLDLKKRMETDILTLPLAELLLTKLQIVHPAAKDLCDVTCLLLNHEFGNRDGDIINLPVTVAYCSADWGLEHTVRHSVFRVGMDALRDEDLSMTEKLTVAERSLALLDALEQRQKALTWRFRGLCGTMYRWWDEVASEPDPPMEDLRILA